MDKDTVGEIIKEKSKKIAKLSTAVGKDFKPESIHKFRVEMKRFRSFLRLLAKGDKKKENRIPHKFKDLYDTCGIIREAQLELEKMDDHALQLPTYSAHLELLIKKHKKEWKKQYSKELVRKFKEKVEKYKLQELGSNVLPGFFYDHVLYIENLYKGLPEDDDVHTIRKQVKDMLYNSKFAEANWKEAFTKIKKLPLKSLDKLSDKLGSYNDRRIMLEHIESFPTATMPKSEKDLLDRFCQKEHAALFSQKKKILGDVKKLSASISINLAETL